MAGQAATQENPGGTHVSDGSVSEPELTEEGLAADLSGAEEAATTETPAEETPAQEATETERAEKPPVTEPVIDLDGQKVPAKDVLAWKSSHEKVTQELQTVAKMKDELKPMQQVVEFSRRNPQFREAFQAIADNAHNPAMLAKILSAVGRGSMSPAGETPAAGTNGAPPEWVARIEQLENEIRVQKQEAALNTAFEKLKNSDPVLKELPPANWKAAREAIHEQLAWLAKNADTDADWDRLLKTAYYAASRDNAVAFAYQKGQEDAAQKAARNKAAPAPKPRGGSSGGAPPSNILESGTEEEQRAELMKMFNE